MCSMENYYKTFAKQSALYTKKIATAHLENSTQPQTTSVLNCAKSPSHWQISYFHISRLHGNLRREQRIRASRLPAIRSLPSRRGHHGPELGLGPPPGAGGGGGTGRQRGESRAAEGLTHCSGTSKPTSRPAPWGSLKARENERINRQSGIPLKRCLFLPTFQNAACYQVKCFY